jgi:hypothetical protein
MLAAVTRTPVEWFGEGFTGGEVTTDRARPELVAFVDRRAD